MSRGFRVWDNQAKSYDWDREFVFSSDGNLMELRSNHNGTWDYHFADEDRFIVEQDTGIKDTNGKMIREGDIVKNIFEPFFEPDIGIVGFDDRRGLYDTYTIENNRTYWTTGSWFCSLMSREDFTTEVIGNIHENPELLEGENET